MRWGRERGAGDGGGEGLVGKLGYIVLLPADAMHPFDMTSPDGTTAPVGRPSNRMQSTPCCA